MRFSPPWFCLVAPLLGALAGLLYGAIFEVGPLTGSAIRGAIIGTPILLYERRLLMPALRERVRQLAKTRRSQEAFNPSQVTVIQGADP